MKTLAQYGPLLEKVAGTLTLTAAIAFGVLHLINAATEADTAAGIDPDEMDTTDYLLSGPNRAHILAALKRHKRGEFVVHDLIEA